MTTREEAICDAAARMFIRYGAKRTGMNDIARETGIARQTLYNIYPNKEAVLAATIELVMSRALEQAKTDLADCHDLTRQMDLVLEHLVRRPFAMLHSTPNAADIIEGVGADSRAAIQRSKDAFRTVLEDLLAPAGDMIRTSGLTVDQLADAVVNLASAAKHEARDDDHLAQLLNSLKTMVLSCAT